MASFSERRGLQAKKAVQFECIDYDLRISLWNALCLHLWKHTREGLDGSAVANSFLKEVIQDAWVNLFNWPLSDIQWDWKTTEKQIHDHFFDAPWYRVYDIVEYLAPQADRFSTSHPGEFVKFCNRVMQRENSAYQFVGGHITPVTNPEEIKDIEAVVSSPHTAVAEQFRRALDALSQRPNGNYYTCVKESFGAIETVARLSLNCTNGTLSKLLPKLKEKLRLHEALVEGFNHLYGWSSDQFRHGQKVEDTFTVDDARYWLVSCSAFSNYLLRLAERAGTLKR